MKQSKMIGTINFTVVYLFIGIVFLTHIPHGLTINDYVSYLTLTLTYFIVAGILLIAYIATPMDIFEPIVFVTFLFLMIFSIVPIINVINGDTTFFGVNIMGGAQKATWIFLASYLAFVVGYYYQKKKVPIKENVVSHVEIPHYTKKEIVVIALIIWLFCYLLSLFGLVRNGKNILYILSIGAMGNVDSSRKIDTPLGFITMFGYSMIPAWMYIYVYGKRSLFKLILFVLTLLVYLIQGFRFIIVILIMAPIVYHYIKKKKRPNPLLLSILIIAMMFMIGIVGYIRGDVRSGHELQWDAFSFNFIIDAVKGNFDLYQPFYGMVQVIPEDIGYSYGSQMFIYTLIMFIPRAIWPNKPYSNLDEVLSASVSKYASNAGIAFPDIGEFYMEFGIVGCILIIFIFGKLCGWCKSLYQGNNRSDHSLIAYSIILPSLMQLIIRGYTPSNFYLILFLLLPILIIKNMTNKNTGDSSEEYSRKKNQDNFSTSG